MTPLSITVVKMGEAHPDPIPDEMWLIQSNITKLFLIERATIVDLEDGRYPQIQFVVLKQVSSLLLVQQ